MPAHDITVALAGTLQLLRAERGWSLDQLVARSGVSKGVLVALEQGRSNPNLVTLARLSDAFGVPVTRLLEVADQPGVQISGPESSRVLWRGPAGGTGTIIGRPNCGTGRCSPARAGAATRTCPPPANWSGWKAGR
jgi:DNA-binding XRE family transcriptional regulator